MKKMITTQKVSFKFFIPGIFLAIALLMNMTLMGVVFATDAYCSTTPDTETTQKGTATQPAKPIPRSWAIKIEREGVPNLYKVSQTLYRSAQPTAKGMQELASMGVKSVLNLRSYHSDEDLIRGTSLRYFHVPMKAWRMKEKNMLKALSIILDPKNSPILVHCQHGADRTGTVCAVYRMAIQGWSKHEAVREMQKGGFGFHEIWSNLIDWLEALDITAFKAKLRRHAR